MLTVTPRVAITKKKQSDTPTYTLHYKGEINREWGWGEEAGGHYAQRGRGIPIETGIESPCMAAGAATLDSFGKEIRLRPSLFSSR